MQISSSQIMRHLDEQIQRTGAWSPVQWLLEQGYLTQDDYQDWRYRRLPVLDTAIGLGGDQLLALLGSAGKVLSALGFSPSAEQYFGWDSSGCRGELMLSADPEVQRTLGVCWARTPSDQLDLFLDCKEIELQNDLIHHLDARRWINADTALCDLREHASNLDCFEDYRRLIDWGRGVSAPLGSSAFALEAEISLVEDIIAPLAQRHLKTGATDYLAPGWKRIAWTLSEMGSGGNSLRHPAIFLARVPDWQGVSMHLQDLRDCKDDAVLQQLYIGALWRTGHREHALLTLAQIVTTWEMPDSQWIRALNVPSASDLWEAFQDSDLDLHRFAAWILLQVPGLAHHVDPADDLSWSPLFSLMLALIKTALRGGEEIALRQALKNQCPELLDIYLRKRSEIRR